MHRNLDILPHTRSFHVADKFVNKSSRFPIIPRHTLLELLEKLSICPFVLTRTLISAPGFFTVKTSEVVESPPHNLHT